MPIDFNGMRDCLKQFDFRQLFIEYLGWSQPAAQGNVPFSVKGEDFTRRPVAQLSGVVVFEVQGKNGHIPDAKARAAVHKELSKHHHENLLIFVDSQRTQSLWYWVKRQDGKTLPRDHLYALGQPGDLFLSKIGQMVFDITDFDATGNVSLVEVADRLRAALDVQRTTKRFFREYEEQHDEFLALIRGVPDDRQRRWYASVLLNRLMFIYFLQKKRFIDNGELNYLQLKLEQSQARGRNRFFGDFLKLLFFEGFAKPEPRRSAEALNLLGSIRYLNGGLFLPHRVEQDNPKLDVPDKAFENLFRLFEKYTWNLNDTPGGKDDEMNPDVLGYIFEKYINQKAFGAYYTRPEITEYLCERTIHRLILAAVNSPKAVEGTGRKLRRYDSVADLLMDLDAPLCRRLLNDVLPQLSLLDPACGSGAFLVAAMKTLINVYSAVIGKIKFLADRNLSEWLRKIEREHTSVNYYIKKAIITDNLYGVDIMEEATEIARLRLFLALVASAETVDQLEPLPNIDFNILPGNSLIGLIKVRDDAFEKEHQKSLFRKSYREVLLEKNRLIDQFRHAAAYADDLTALRDDIEKRKDQARETLDDILLDEFNSLKIRFDEATWEEKKGIEGKPKKRALTADDVQDLQPFHWGFEFDEILNKRGGFDAIITNPPWEIFKPNGKEFFQQFSDLVTRKKMTIHEFLKKQDELLSDVEIRKAWLKYRSGYPHANGYFRSAPQYRNQISIVNGKKAASDINLYKLFLEQCYNLLRPGGDCGIVIPSGLYTDLGATQLREMLFTSTNVTGIFGFENRKEIFEGVDSRFKFVVLTFEKGGVTEQFPAAFMRHEVSDLERFPQQDGIEISVSLVRKLAPDSLSIPEFASAIDVCIVEKMLQFPLLGDKTDAGWQLTFAREFHMTDDSPLFKTSPGTGRLPLLEGKMIWQFDHQFSQPRYWIAEKDGRDALLRGDAGSTDRITYQCYRLGFRDNAASTNERTAIATVIPPGFFTGNTITIVVPTLKASPSGSELLFVSACFNSFVYDWFVRKKVTNHLRFFYVYQTPIPRLGSTDRMFAMIVRRAAKLICVSPEFDALAKEVGLVGHKHGIIDPIKRADLRAELDGLLAHLYGLTEVEFAHVLATFPIVSDSVKAAAQNAFRDVERGLIT